MPSLNLFRRQQSARPTLRQRAADLKAGLSRVVQQPTAPSAEPEPAPDFAERVAQAGSDHDVLAGGGIDHRDGTVSYADASGKVSRRPMAHWIGFNALQMHGRVRSEIGRRRVLEANHLPSDEHEVWEARARRELRSDAVHALAFRHDRAFEAAQAIRTGAEPATQALRQEGDAELLALAPLWEAALDLYQRLSDEEALIAETASEDGWPGPAPDGAGPEWRSWFQQKEAWREQTGVASAEEASGEAGTALFRIEEQIADLPAASLAGLKLKARVAQRSDDIGGEWVFGLAQGLVRDILTFTEPAAVDWHNPPPGFMAAPAIEPSSFTQIHTGIAIELSRLRGIALAEFERRTGPGTSAEDVEHHRRNLHLDTLLRPAQGRDSFAVPIGAPGLIDQIDIASASLEDLQALHDVANTVADVASAMAWTGRCHARGWGEQDNPGDHYNAAGKLMQWLGDALTDVESRANQEARRRRPTTPDERETRLEMLALPVIQNGDHEETAAFARELAAHAEAERAGR